MIDRNKRIRVYFAWAFIALVVGIALLIVSFGCASYIEAMKEASPYIAIAGLAFLLASFILFLLRRKEVRKKEEAVERDGRGRSLAPPFLWRIGEPRQEFLRFENGGHQGIGQRRLDGPFPSDPRP